MKGIATCSPSSSAFLAFKDMKLFSSMYAIDVGTLEMEVTLLSQSIASLCSTVTTMIDLGRYLHSCLPAFRNLYERVQIALTIAVTSTKRERFFSSLKRIKTRLRTTMGEDRLSDLSILSIEREMTSSFLL